MRFDADASQDWDDSVLKLVKRVVEMVNGSGVEVELLLQVAQRMLENFFLLVNDVISQSSDEMFQVGLKD